MNILYIGDVMGEVGIEVVEKVLPDLRRSKKIDAVIAQAENVTNGKGLSRMDYDRLRAAGVDGFTGGNHTTKHADTKVLLLDPGIPVTGPANLLDCPGPGFKYLSGAKGKVLIISLLGHVVGLDADRPVTNPLHKIDEILQHEAPQVPVVINFHGDYSSEKVIIGHYLDGRVSAVIGDHWHVPSADTQVLPKGTAHQTDVGMCGSLDSSLGITYDSVIPRWRDNVQTKNVLETTGRRQFNAVLVHTGDDNLATDVQRIRQIF